MLVMPDPLRSPPSKLSLELESLAAAMARDRELHALALDELNARIRVLESQVQSLQLSAPRGLP
jgi:hypothetical protein